jgi:YopT-type cysteine protease-like protein
MLPNVLARGGTNTFTFGQAVDFPINIASTTRDGVCSGLSLHWVKKHKLDQMATFLVTIKTPSSIRDVENFQSTIAGAAASAYNRTLAATGLSQGVGKDINTGVTAARVSQVLALTPSGYELMSFFRGGGQHTIALARTGNGVDFFDPNYGCANFPTRDSFKAWFINDYWNVAGGPGNPGPCTRFLVISFI